MPGVGAAVSGLVSTTLSILVLIGVGFLARQTRLLTREHAPILNNLIIYVAMPALIFRAMHAATITPRLLIFPAVGLIAASVTLAFCLLLAGLLRLPRGTLGAFLIAGSMGNTGYLGYPMTIEIFGFGNLPKAIFYDVFGTVVIVLTAGIYVAGRYGEAKDGVHPARQILTFPPLIGVILALALKSVALPGFVDTALSYLAAAAVPLIVMTIGLSLELGDVPSNARPLSLLALAKLVVSPAVALLVGVLLGLVGSDLGIVVLQASMPSLMFSLILGVRYRLDLAFLPAAIVATTMAGLVTIPAWQVIIPFLVQR